MNHPEDWLPSAVSGNFREGYARLNSPTRQAIQVRWHRGKGHDIETALDRYLQKIEQESRRRKQPFRSERRPQDGRILYRWVSNEQGRGSIFLRGESLYFLEVTGSKNDSLLQHLQAARASFATYGAGWLHWSVLGLAVTLPQAFRLEKHEFVAGKTQLIFSRGRERLECTRWGFAEELLKRYTLEDWARASLDMRKSEAIPEGPGIRLSESTLLSKKEALVALQREQNQIVTLRAQAVGKSEELSWDWIA